MALPSKLQADYVELIHTYLDALPVQKVEDFDRIQSVLNDFLEKKEIKGEPNSLHDRVHSLQEMFENPEFYAEPQYQESFQELILERVRKKIDEIRELTPLEKTNRIEEQVQKRLEVEANHKRMGESSAPLPGSEAHVVSFEEWLRELGRAQELAVQENQELLFAHYILAQLVISGLPVEVYANLSFEDQCYVIGNWSSFAALMGEGVPFLEILTLEPALRAQILSNASAHMSLGGQQEYYVGVAGLVRCGLSFQQLIQMEPESRDFLIKENQNIVVLLSANAQLDDILNLDPTFKAKLFDDQRIYCHSVAALDQRGVTFRFIISQEKGLRRLLIGYGIYIAELIDMGITLEMILAHPCSECILRQSTDLKALLNYGMTWNSIQELPHEIQEFALGYGKTIVPLLTLGASLEDLYKLKKCSSFLLFLYPKFLTKWVEKGHSFDILMSAETRALGRAIEYYDHKSWHRPNLDALPEAVRSILEEESGSSSRGA